MRFAALALFLPAILAAAVEGTVTNATSGKPQPGATVTLMKLGAGMDTVATVTSGPDGRFQFAHDMDPAVPYLIQANHGGVNYNRMIQPGAPPTRLDVQVFDSVANPGAAKVVQHMILLEPSASELVVNESVIYQNDGKQTWNNPDGTFRFYLPPEANGNVRVTATAQGGMPLNREAEKTGAQNIFVVKYPVKPGETRFDLAYTLPATAAFDSKIVHGGGPVRIVAPNGVTLTGEDIASLGPEPRTQATVYEVKTADYTVRIEGTGSLRAAAAESGETEDTGPSIEQVKPRIYERLPWVLALTIGILAAGFILLFRSGKLATGTRK